MSELQTCTTCKFKAPVSKWATSFRGNKFNSCIKCREYHRTHRKEHPEARLKQLERKLFKYHSDAITRGTNLEVLYVICDVLYIVV